ncbi:MAG TPA: DUF4230 domain-containing protein [Polyangiaceae bacterium]|jgi:hypothetical protein|nr:DUF4230 domain-containing protein [Polyangiaceae bacterium]
MAYPEGEGERSRARAGWAKALTWWLAVVSLGLGGYVAMTSFSPGPGVGPVVRPTGTILMAVKDLARLETNELHLEKVIDLTDKQSRFFGLIDTADAILLIAAGDVTVGIDLTKLGANDVAIDREAGTARLTLPPPEILSVRLDEQHTYVYRRTTGVLAERNEQLESKARKEAIRAIEEAARHGDIMEKARRQAEKQLQQLFEKFGVSRTTIGWRPA